MLPKIALQICTYNRYDEIQLIVKMLQKHLEYPKELIHLYVCDDSSPGDYIERLQKLKLFQYWETTFISTKKNSGWGANVNNGLNSIQEDLVFFCEDDYYLGQKLPLYAAVALLLVRKNIGMLRFRATAGGHFVYHQFEADISGVLDPIHMMYMDTMYSLPQKVTYLQLDSGSHDLYLYSHGPHLKYKSFNEFHGPYVEGKKLGETEDNYAHRVKDRMRSDPYNCPAIAILPEWVTMRWDHIGKSYQHTEADK
jgi:glycosyltransferase involved in cell wall biosynthesis